MSEEGADPRNVEGRVSGEAGDGWLSRLWLRVADRYERYQYLEEDDRELLQWHNWGSIVSHWSMVLFLLLATVTGLAIWTGWYGPLEVGIWGGYHVAFVIHVWAGVLLAVAAFLLYPYYALVVDGESPLVTVEQIQEQVVIALSFLGLASYIPGYKKARRTYDEEADEWIGYHPMQTAFWYATWFFAGTLTLSGFALWADLSTDPAWWIAGIGFLYGTVAYETLLRIHLLATALFVASAGIHAYFGLSPSNRDLLFSMIHGKLYGWSVDDETRPEGRGETRTKDGLAKRFDPAATRLGTGLELQERVDPTVADSATADVSATDGEPTTDGDPRTDEPGDGKERS